MHITLRPSAFAGAAEASVPINSICQRSLEVKSLQQHFERQAPAYYLSAAGQSQCRQIADERFSLAQAYQQKGMHRDAGIELRFAAYCLEISVIHPFQEGRFDFFNGAQLRVLNEAVRHRYSAVREFRREAERYSEDPRAQRELALEISFLAKTLTFALDRLPGLNGPKGVAAIINLRLEAAGKFLKLGDHVSVFYEYRHLAILCNLAGDARAPKFARRALDQLSGRDHYIPGSCIASLTSLIQYFREMPTPPATHQPSSSPK